MPEQHQKPKKIRKRTKKITERRPSKEANTNMKEELKRRKKTTESYGRYIYKVLKQVHDDIAISSKAMNTMQSFVTDIFERLGMEVQQIMKKSKLKTIKARDIEAAVKLVIPGELGNHALNEGRKAVRRYYENI